MTKYVRRSELIEKANNIIDLETGMTELDYEEWCDPYQDIVIIEDVPEYMEGGK